MDLEEINEVPKFTHDIDAATHRKLPIEAVDLAETIAVHRQNQRWASETARLAFNLAVQTEKKINKVIYAGIALFLYEAARFIFSSILKK